MHLVALTAENFRLCKKSEVMPTDVKSPRRGRAGHLRKSPFRNIMHRNTFGVTTTNLQLGNRANLQKIFGKAPLWKFSRNSLPKNSLTHTDTFG